MSPSLCGPSHTEPVRGRGAGRRLACSTETRKIAYAAISGGSAAWSIVSPRRRSSTPGRRGRSSEYSPRRRRSRRSRARPTGRSAPRVTTGTGRSCSSPPRPTVPARARRRDRRSGSGARTWSRCTSGCGTRTPTGSTRERTRSSRRSTKPEADGSRRGGLRSGRPVDAVRRQIAVARSAPEEGAVLVGTCNAGAHTELFVFCLSFSYGVSSLVTRSMASKVFEFLITQRSPVQITSPRRKHAAQAGSHGRCGSRAPAEHAAPSGLVGALADQAHGEQRVLLHLVPIVQRSGEEHVQFWTLVRELAAIREPELAAAAHHLAERGVRTGVHGEVAAGGDLHELHVAEREREHLGQSHPGE